MLQSADSPHASSSQHADIIPIYSLILENLMSRASHGMITRKKQSTSRISFLPAPYLSWGAARLVEWCTQDPSIGHLTGTEQTLNLRDPEAGGRPGGSGKGLGCGVRCQVAGTEQACRHGASGKLSASSQHWVRGTAYEGSQMWPTGLWSGDHNTWGSPPPPFLVAFQLGCVSKHFLFLRSFQPWLREISRLKVDLWAHLRQRSGLFIFYFKDPRSPGSPKVGGGGWGGEH